MFRIRHLKLAYAVAGSSLAAYWWYQLLSYHRTTHPPVTTGTLLCLLLFAAIPAVGYVVLFKLFPLAGRLLRR